MSKNTSKLLGKSEQLNKKGSRYRKLMEIRSKNCMRLTWKCMPSSQIITLTDGTQFTKAELMKLGIGFRG